MRVLVCPDSFGGTLSAPQAAEAIRTGWLEAAPADRVDTVPLSDGGPGFVDVLHATLGGDLVAATVPGPLGHPTPGSVLVSGSTAYVESAQACGLHLMPVEQRDPKRSHTRGVGALLRLAATSGAATVVVGLGGSGTNDGGAGLLAQLGVRLLDTRGHPLPSGGAALRELAQAVPPAVWPPYPVQLLAATDVDNPLLGLEGASAVFGPQKGASSDDVQRLDAALTVYADVVERDLPAATNLRAAPGAGAAGGLGFGLLALGARRVSGVDVVLDAVGLRAALADADLVITGEGSFDAQSLRGKVVAGVARLAAEHAVPCLVLAGRVDVGRREAAAAGVEAAWSLVAHAGSSERALSEAGGTLSSLAHRVASQWSRPG